jgi:hypothetical protein
MKLNPRIKAVKPETGFRLRLTFSNGEVRIYDVSPLLDQGGVFDELKNASAFRSVHPWHGTVQWAGGQDICPDTLYEDSIPLGKAKPAAVCEKRAMYRTKRPMNRK